MKNSGGYCGILLCAILLLVLVACKSSTSTTLTSSVNPSIVGASVTFTATISGTGGSPTGNVTFSDGNTSLGTAPVNSGVSGFTTSSLVSGTHSITAQYLGDSNFNGSTSAVLSQVVNTSTWSQIAPPQGGGGFEPLFDPLATRDASAGVDVFIGQRSGVLYSVGGPLPNSPRTWGATGIPTSTPEGGDLGAARVAVSHESNQRITLFVADDDVNAPIPSTVWQMTQTNAGSPATNPNGWTQWNSIGNSLPGPLGQPEVGYSSGAQYVFIPASGTNSLYLNRETSAGSGQWSGWQNLGGTTYTAYRPAVTSTADGRIEVFVRDQGSIKHIWQTSQGGSWSSWTNLPAGPLLGTTGDVAVGSDSAVAGARAGCLEVLVVGANSHLYQTSQITPGVENWSAWTDLGGVGQPMTLGGRTGIPFASPTIGGNGDGTMEAYVAAADNNVYRIRQTTPGGSWGSWASLGSAGPALASNPAVGVILHNDLLQLFVLGADGNVYHLSQRSESTW